MTTEREARLQVLDQEYGDYMREMNGEPFYAHTTGDYVLVESSSYSSGYFVTVHEALEDAAAYHDGQETPEDWDIQFVINVNTGSLWNGQTETISKSWFEPADEWMRNHYSFVVTPEDEYFPTPTSDADLVRALTREQVDAICIGLQDAGHTEAAEDFRRYWDACIANKGETL